MTYSKRSAFAYACMVSLFWHTAYAADITAATKADRSAALSLQNAFTSTADEVKPAVVFIAAEHKAEGRPNMPNMRELFPGFPFPDGPDQGDGDQPRSVSTGSGVIVRPDGYIMTNQHVVAGADRVTVKLNDGREFTGKVMEDPTSDIAIVKVEAKGLPTAKLGDSDTVKVGQWAMAVGSPFGLTNTVTVGVVSALTREATIPDPSSANKGRYYPDLIQTDASINPGNSGGPLVNINGEVIGINTLIESPSGANAGIGFSVPVNSAKFVMNQLITSGKVVRGYLGLVPLDISPAKAKALGVDKGALVDSVAKDTPAQVAGIKPMDVVTQIGVAKIGSALELRRTVASTKPGTKVAMTIFRDGKPETVQVTIGETPGAGERVGAVGKTKVGLTVDALSAQMAERLGIDEDTPGVVVRSVENDSAAGRSNPTIRPGDIILKINRQPTKTVAQFNKAVAELKSGDTALVLLQRGKSTTIAELTLD